jgi:hypothetical protein
MLRERFGIYTDATCPAGTTRDLASAPRNSVLICIAEFGVKSAGQCLAGGTPTYITDASRDSAVVCIPASTASYPLITTGGPQDFPCRPGDYLGFSDTEVKCIPAGSSATTTTSSSSGESLNELSARLTALRTQYTALVNQGAQTPAQIQTLLPQIQSVNQQIAAVLDQMITQTQYVPPGPNSDTYRDQLVEQLARIQSDYNGLKTNTDALKTLRRIRSFQDTSWQSTLALYLTGFLVVALLLVLVMLFRRQKSVSPTAPSMSPTAMPPLM